VHVTLRARGGLPSLRSERIYGMFNSILRDQRKRRYAGAFQVVEFTVQDDHLHLIVEARGLDAHRILRAGVSGLVIAFAKRLNMILRRRGRVWGDRWHGRELGSPREVRNALVYVFRNLAKHGTLMIGQDIVDVMSSALRFRGWTRSLTFHFDDGLQWPTAPPRTPWTAAHVLASAADERGAPLHVASHAGVIDDQAGAPRRFRDVRLGR